MVTNLSNFTSALSADQVVFDHQTPLALNLPAEQVPFSSNNDLFIVRSSSRRRVWGDTDWEFCDFVPIHLPHEQA
ncbi:MAG: hypothetical protein IPG80_18565 [Anaerolineales bacterium]|uniref:hypothetical protein n=1 Tax=Candidatus Villigracilis vicinus TaxID=3140679 RepID=UPI00313702F9|nr:hypothetical protein [Anaerolineales bacterium]